MEMGNFNSKSIGSTIKPRIGVPQIGGVVLSGAGSVLFGLLWRVSSLGGIQKECTRCGVLLDVWVGALSGLFGGWGQIGCCVFCTLDVQI